MQNSKRIINNNATRSNTSTSTRNRSINCCCHSNCCFYDNCCQDSQEFLMLAACLAAAGTGQSDMSARAKIGCSKMYIVAAAVAYWCRAIEPAGEVASGTAFPQGLRRLATRCKSSLPPWPFLVPSLVRACAFTLFVQGCKPLRVPVFEDRIESVCEERLLWLH